MPTKICPVARLVTFTEEWRPYYDTHHELRQLGQSGELLFCIYCAQRATPFSWKQVICND